MAVFADTESVLQLLERVREILRGGGKFYLIQRQKNRDSLLQLGLSVKSCRAEVMALSIEDYCSGPEDDPKGNGKVWIFGREINGTPVYIKLKISRFGAGSVTCISFHKAEFPLKYVYRDEEST
ncbi:MAG: type II toxin-antitoxin system MqsR family toxin [SAR324 cluster bacterium]|uniref:Type II toxin-antitoxin system MqsR family toxin n=1 Tax=SAR324 cluster bacterium TaxID=2024889 RepID=A0A7X9IMQ4_9DELT|nr:type II toxin-antitoxin system MqsR family toxin [SAR324 cluster bacterium]